jgi:hypothetical protein
MKFPWPHLFLGFSILILFIALWDVLWPRLLDLYLLMLF